MHPEDSENDEECATDEDNVTNGLQGGEKSLDNEFEPRSAIDDSQGLESSDQSEHSQHSEYFALLANNGGDRGVHEGDDDKDAVHPVPVVRKIAVGSVPKSNSNPFHEHF